MDIEPETGEEMYEFYVEVMQYLGKEPTMQKTDVQKKMEKAAEYAAELGEKMKKGDIESVKGAVAKYEEAARVCDEPAAGWGPRNAFSFASAPAGAAKHGVSASVILG